MVLVLDTPREENSNSDRKIEVIILMNFAIFVCFFLFHFNNGNRLSLWNVQGE